MSNEDRNQRIFALKVKNKRENVVKMLHSIAPNLSIDSFLGIEETEEIKKRIYQHIDNSSQQEKLPKGTGTTINKMMSVKTGFDSYLDETAYLLYDGDRETGAITVKLNDIYLNVESILNFTEFSKDFSDLHIVGSKFNFGLCIERQEYNNLFVYWTE